MNTYAIIDNLTGRIKCMVKAENSEFAMFRSNVDRRLYKRVAMLAKEEDGYHVYVEHHAVPPWVQLINKDNILQYFKFAEAFRVLPEN